jgi:hypothetical protein
MIAQNIGLIAIHVFIAAKKKIFSCNGNSEWRPSSRKPFNLEKINHILVSYIDFSKSGCI